MSTSPQARRIILAAVAVVGLSVAVGRHRSPAPVASFPAAPMGAAAAQAPADDQVHIAPLSDTGVGGADAGWRRFQVTLPRHSPLVDLHTALLIDNKGSEQVQERTSPWPQSFVIKFKLDTDDDYRVKTILKAQGLATKENLVTCHFQAASLDSAVGFYETVKFQHQSYGVGEEAGGSPQQGGIGEKMVLMDKTMGDSSLHSLSVAGLGSIKRIPALDALPPGKAHRFTVYVMLTPHHGPLRSQSSALPITRD